MNDIRPKNPKRLSRKKRRELVERVVGPVPWNQFEAGIYNYCDRWCEKCGKTEKCYLYFSTQQEEQEMIAKGLDPYDPKNALDIVGKSLKQTGELLSKISEAEGIDMAMTSNDEKEYEAHEKAVDPSNEKLYKDCYQLRQEISDWLESVPPLDFAKYKEEYEKLNWHHFLLPAKIYRSLSGKKEALLQKDSFLKKCDLDDSINSAWVVYRSTKICKESLEYMNNYVGDPRILPLADKCGELLQQIEKELLSEIKK